MAGTAAPNPTWVAAIHKSADDFTPLGDTPISPAAVWFTPSVESTLATFLDRLAPVGDVPARELLTVLAFADAPGLPPTSGHSPSRRGCGTRPPVRNST